MKVGARHQRDHPHRPVPRSRDRRIPRLDVIAPLEGASGEPAGAIILSRDPRDFLYPLLQDWPSPSSSSETLLFRQEDDTVLYLNDLRFAPDSALRRPRAPDEHIVACGAGPDRRPAHRRGRRLPRDAGVRRPWRSTPALHGTWSPRSTRPRRSPASTRVRRLPSPSRGAILLVVGLGLALAWRVRSAEYYREQLRIERESEERFRSVVELLADRHAPLPDPA